MKFYDEENDQVFEVEAWVGDLKADRITLSREGVNLSVIDPPCSLENFMKYLDEVNGEFEEMFGRVK